MSSEGLINIQDLAPPKTADGKRKRKRKDMNASPYEGNSNE